MNDSPALEYRGMIRSWLKASGLPLATDYSLLLQDLVVFTTVRDGLVHAAGVSVGKNTVPKTLTISSSSDEGLNRDN